MTDDKPGSKPAAPSLVEHVRLSDIARTVERRIDVARAFCDEAPTMPAAPSKRSRAASAEPKRRSDDGVQVLVPLDLLPELAIADTELPWPDLGTLATELLLRIDGSRSIMSIVTGLSAAPNEAVRELASLIGRGFVRLRPPADTAAAPP